MYLVALFLSSFKLPVGCMQRLSANGRGRRAVNIWCMATSKLRFRMFITTLLNLLTKVLKESPFSWRIPTRAMEVRWCGWLVANYVSNLDISVMKLSMEKGGSFLNQLKAPPLRDVGNTRHMTASSVVYRLKCVVYALMCSSRSVMSS